MNVGQLETRTRPHPTHPPRPRNPPAPPTPQALGAPRGTRGAPRSRDPSDGEAGPEHPADQVGVGAELVEAHDVARLERPALVLAELVAGEVVVGEALPGLVPARDRGQDPVERVRGPDHGCTQTVAQPVIHSATGSQARTSPFPPGPAPRS